MSAKSNLNQQIAETLAAPFTAVKGRGSQPLSHRALENGGMVVITADGRKLWFSAEEVAEASEKLTGEPREIKNQPAPVRPAAHTMKNTAAPAQSPRAYDGMPVLTVLPPQKAKPSQTGGNH